MKNQEHSESGGCSYSPPQEPERGASQWGYGDERGAANRMTSGKSVGIYAANQSRKNLPTWPYVRKGNAMAMGVRYPGLSDFAAAGNKQLNRFSRKVGDCQHSCRHAHGRSRSRWDWRFILQWIRSARIITTPME